MVGMNEVGIAVPLGGECEDPTVRAAFVEILGAVVGAGFQTCDLRDLRLQGAEGCLYFLDLRRAGGVLELEGDDVAEMTVVLG